MDNLLAYIYISIYNMYYHYTLLFPIPTQYDDNVASGAPGWATLLEYYYTEWKGGDFVGNGIFIYFYIIICKYCSLTTTK